MTETRRATVWCTILGRLVEVAIVRDPSSRIAVPRVPEGWRVVECLERDVACFGKGCPFTTDEAGSPFGEVGECDRPHH